MSVLFLWLPVFAICVHMFEEFVWPGGFAQWYRAYPPGRSTAVSVRFLVLGNAVFVALALAVVGITTLLRLRLVGFATLIQAVLIACAYSAWSTWRHGRHAVARRGS